MEKTEKVERKKPDSAVLSFRTDGYENKENHPASQKKLSVQFIRRLKVENRHTRKVLSKQIQIQHHGSS